MVSVLLLVQILGELLCLQRYFKMDFLHCLSSLTGILL